MKEEKIKRLNIVFQNHKFKVFFLAISMNKQTMRLIFSMQLDLNLNSRNIKKKIGIMLRSSSKVCF